MSLPELRQPKAPEQHRFHYLDALRGLAALCVVLLHYSLNLTSHPVAVSSYLAVDFFFCLSGFVVALSYQQRLGTTLGFRDYAVTRIIRLYPTAILGTLLGALVLLHDHSPLVWRTLPLWAAIPYAILSGLLILPLPRGILFPLDLPMWTLFLELMANFAFGLLMRLRLARTGVLAGIAALSFAGLVYDRARYNKIDIGFTSYSVLVGIHRVCFSFFVGILLYRLYMHRRPARIHGPLALAIAAVSTVLLVSLFFTPGPLIRSSAADLLSIAVGFPFLIYWSARLQLPSFTTKAFAAIGALSYPLYILHLPLLQPLSYLHLNPGLFANGIRLVYLALIVALAWLVAMYYDVPVRRALIRKLRG